MQVIQQTLFIILTTGAIALFAKKAREIYRNINLGRDEDISGNAAER